MGDQTSHLPMADGSLTEVMYEVLASFPMNPGAPRISKPPNAFMLYRTWMSKSQLLPEQRQVKISCVAGECWNLLSREGKEPFRKLAKDLSALHKRTFPNYKCTLKRRALSNFNTKREDDMSDYIRHLREKYMHISGPAPPSRRSRDRQAQESWDVHDGLGSVLLPVPGPSSYFVSQDSSVPVVASPTGIQTPSSVMQYTTSTSFESIDRIAGKTDAGCTPYEDEHKVCLDQCCCSLTISHFSLARNPSTCPHFSEPHPYPDGCPSNILRNKPK